MTTTPFLLRVSPILAIITIASINTIKHESYPQDTAGTASGTIIVFNGSPILGSGNELWKFDYDQSQESARCWQNIADLDNPNAKIHTLLQIDDVLEIGTLNDGLSFYDGKIHKETGYSSINVINALAQIDQEQTLVGTLGDTPVEEKESGLWNWTRSTNKWDVDQNNFPASFYVTAILVDTSSSQKTIYVGTRFNGIIKREPGWWEKMGGMNLGMGVYATLHSEIQQIAVSTYGNHIVYAVAATTDPSSQSYQGFFRIDNPDQEDAVWQRPQIGKSPYGYNVWSVATDPTIDRGVWIGTEKGLFYSFDAGDTWEQIEINPEPAKIYAILPFDKYLMIILTSDGVMKASLSESRGSEPSSPRWIKYIDDGSGKRLCPTPGSLTAQPISPTVSPVPSITDTPTAAGSPSTVASHMPSVTPTSTPSPYIPIEKDIVPGIVAVLLILVASIIICIGIKRYRRISVLFLAAEPTDAAPLRLEKEVNKIQDQLQKSRYRDRYNLIPKMAVTSDILCQELVYRKPQIVHFSGHGTESGKLCLETPDGKAQPVSAKALSDLFKQFSGHVKCVLLIACYMEKQAAAIAEHIDYVIGMKNEIDNETAMAFVMGFYTGLGDGKNYEEAFHLGCAKMGLDGIPDRLKPILTKNKNKLP